MENQLHVNLDKTKCHMFPYNEFLVIMGLFQVLYFTVAAPDSTLTYQVH